MQTEHHFHYDVEPDEESPLPITVATCCRCDLVWVVDIDDQPPAVPCSS